MSTKPVPRGLMCLTRDDPDKSHAAQALEFCRSGARLIQMRSKRLHGVALHEAVRSFSCVCRHHGVYSILNDHVHLACEVEVDAVHLGAADMPWVEARRLLPAAIALGGTINNAHQARFAGRSGVLNYAGVGPWRFTASKERLAPVLGPEGIGPLVQALAPLPCFVIGGLHPTDMPLAKALGAHGVAVCAPLHVQNTSHTISEYQTPWNH